MLRRKSIRIAVIAAVAMLAAPAAADVWVAANGATLDVVVYGNAADSSDQYANAALAIRQTDWHQLWQGDPDQKGWIAVACVRRPDGEVHFTYATEHPTEEIALDLARRAGQKFIERNGGGSLLEGCGGAVNNHGQVIAERFKPKVAP